MSKPLPTKEQLVGARVVRIKPRQKQVLDAFAFLTQKNGVFPSGLDVVEHTGLKPNQVDRAITVLLEKGLIKKNRH